MKKVLTLKEAAAYLGMAVGSLYNLTCKNAITHYKPGGKLIYFKVEDLDKFLLRNCIESVTNNTATVQK